MTQRPCESLPPDRPMRFASLNPQAAIERIRTANDLKHIEGHRFTVGGQPLEQGSSAVSRVGVIAVGPDFSQIGAHCVSGV